jgi:hypothetical protein
MVVGTNDRSTRNVSSVVNSRELTATIKDGTSRILRLLEERLEKLAIELEAERDPVILEARRLLSQGIIEAETSEVIWAEGLHGKIIRIETVSNGPIE